MTTWVILILGPKSNVFSHFSLQKIHPIIMILQLEHLTQCIFLKFPHGIKLQEFYTWGKTLVQYSSTFHKTSREIVLICPYIFLNRRVHYFNFIHNLIFLKKNIYIRGGQREQWLPPTPLPLPLFVLPPKKKRQY